MVASGCQETSPRDGSKLERYQRWKEWVTVSDGKVTKYQTTLKADKALPELVLAVPIQNPGHIRLLSPSPSNDPSAGNVELLRVNNSADR